MMLVRSVCGFSQGYSFVEPTQAFGRKKAQKALSGGDSLPRAYRRTHDCSMAWRFLRLFVASVRRLGVWFLLPLT